MNKDLSPTSSSGRKKRRYADDPERHRQTSLYELSYMDGLKRDTEDSEDRRQKINQTPLKYQLQEIDSDSMMLQPLPVY